MSNGLTTEEQKTIAAVFARVPEIERAVLFGSRAMGLARSNSDVDIALYGDKLGLPDILHTASLLEETPLPYHFDLISRASITSPELLEHIRQYGKEMYRKERNTPTNSKTISAEEGEQSSIKRRLGDICIKIGSGATPRGGKEAYKERGIAIIRSQNVLDYTFSADGLAYIDDMQAAQLDNVTVQKNDVLVNITGDSVARACIAPNELLPARVNQHVAIVRADCKKANSHYLLYFLQFKKEYLLSIASSGGTRNALTKKMLEDIEVNLPPLATQCVIAATLSSLDDKIENNRKINQCLEQMAQAIFKSWFVDFEPWGGVMPSDWREGTLSEIADITMGQSPAGISYNEEGLGAVFYQGRAEFGFRFPTRRLFTTQPKRMATKGDVLISVRAPVGDLNVAWEPCCIGRGLAAIQSKSGCQSFVLYTMLSLKQQFDVFDGQGTVFGSINKNDMANLPVLIPSDEVLCQFEKLVNPMDAAIEKNYFESCNLLSIRDALLPKLLSGEIRIPVAEKIVEEIK